MKKPEDEAQSLETALRIAQAQNRELRNLREKTEGERDEARKLAEDMHQFDPQQRKLPWVRPSTVEEKLDLALKALRKIDQLGGAMRGEWASEKAAETLEQIQ